MSELVDRVSTFVKVEFSLTTEEHRRYPSHTVTLEEWVPDAEIQRMQDDLTRELGGVWRVVNAPPQP
jgi:hypothetical protein